MRIGEFVLHLLNEREIKSAVLARHLGIGNSTVYGWKEPNRNPSSELILPICDFFNISPDYLLAGGKVEAPEMDSTENGATHQKKLLTENEEMLVSILAQFESKDDQIEFIGRARKLARDMKLEILSVSEEESRKYI